MASVFPVSTVLRVTGLTQRQLTRLERLGIVEPSVAVKEGPWPSLYSFRDLIRLRVAAEMLVRDMNAPDIRRLMDELERRGIDDPLTTIRFVGDPPEEPDPATGRRWHGRVFVVDPNTDEPRSPRHLEQPAELFDLQMRDLTAEIEGTIAQLTKRQHVRVEKVRGVQTSEPVISGTRVPARVIAKLARDGWSTARILRSYPSLTRSDVKAAVRFESEAVA